MFVSMIRERYTGRVVIRGGARVIEVTVTGAAGGDWGGGAMETVHGNDAVQCKAHRMIIMVSVTAW